MSNLNLIAAVVEHRNDVELWREMSVIASAGFPAPLTDAQTQAYALLPYMLDQCKESYARIPVGAQGRPQHYLMTS